MFVIVELWSLLDLLYILVLNNVCICPIELSTSMPNHACIRNAIGQGQIAEL